jgi:hypothetical protein
MKHLLFLVALSVCSTGALAQKTYKHAPEYQVAVLDESLRVHTGADATVAKTGTDAKMDQGGQGMHVLHTAQGNYRVEAPVNKGMSILSAMNSNAYRPAVTFHNKWFLDNVQPGTKVLFASRCNAPNKKHPNETVRCTFWFPDPDSDSHEYETMGDFTPWLAGDGSNTVKTANTLCGTGKLNPATEAELCGGASIEGPAAPPPTPPYPTPAPGPQPATQIAPTSSTPAPPYACGAGSQCAPIQPK